MLFLFFLMYSYLQDCRSQVYVCHIRILFDCLGKDFDEPRPVRNFCELSFIKFLKVSNITMFAYFIN